MNKHGTDNITPEIARAIEGGDVVSVRAFFNGELGVMSLPALRITAQNLGISPVYGFSKDELINLIKEKQCSPQQ